jgi:hypothetical protein
MATGGLCELLIVAKSISSFHTRCAISRIVVTTISLGESHGTPIATRVFANHFLSVGAPGLEYNAKDGVERAGSAGGLQSRRHLDGPSPQDRA